MCNYSKTCVKRPLSKRSKIGFQDQLSLNAGQKYCRMLLGILQYFWPSLSYHLSLKSLFCLFWVAVLHRFYYCIVLCRQWSPKITYELACDFVQWCIPGRVAQSVTCLATDACLTADPGVASSIPARSHTFVEIDHEIISTVILLPSADSFKKGCCQLQAKVCAQITG